MPYRSASPPALPPAPGILDILLRWLGRIVPEVLIGQFLRYRRVYGNGWFCYDRFGMNLWLPESPSPTSRFLFQVRGGPEFHYGPILAYEYNPLVPTLDSFIWALIQCALVHEYWISKPGEYWANRPSELHLPRNLLQLAPGVELRGNRFVQEGRGTV